jgi:hypothetical protein
MLNGNNKKEKHYASPGIKIRKKKKSRVKEDRGSLKKFDLIELFRCSIFPVVQYQQKNSKRKKNT